MKKIAFALALWSVWTAAAVQAADIVVVRGTYAEAMKTPEGATTFPLYQIVARDMKAAGLDFSMLRDEEVATGSLSGAKLAIFPYTPLWAPGEAEAAISFVKSGGKVVVCYICPPDLAQALGFKLGEYIQDRERTGRFDSCRLAAKTPSILGLPQVFTQRSSNVTTAAPDRADAIALYNWYNAKGEATGVPALLLSDSGAFMTHVFTEPDAAAKSKLLLAIAGHFLPDLWTAAARSAIDGAWTFDAFSSPDQLADLIAHAKIRGVANNPGPAFDRARDLTARAEQASAAKLYPDALALAGQARKAALEAYARCQPSRPVEMRSVWIQTAFGVDKWGWEKSIRHLRDNGFNALLPCMCWGGVAYYKSDVLPVAPEVAKRGDQLAECMKWCRKYGVELHAWRVNWNLGGSHTPAAFREQLRRESRLQMDPQGKEIDWLCPSDDRNFALERDSMLELVRKYHVDGIHLDYIRYPDLSGCYCPRCRERFEARLGRKVEQWPADVITGPLASPWLDFRRDNISRLVETVGTEAHRIDPHCKVSAAVYGWWESSRDPLGQDWVFWVQKGWLDFVTPMDYLPGNEELGRIITRNVGWVDGTMPLYIGLGEWLLKDAAHLIYQIDETRSLGADGYVLFHYDHPEFTDDRLPMLRLGATREPALFPHRGPAVRWQMPTSLEDAAPSTFLEGSVVTVKATLAADAPGDAFLELRRLDGSAIQPLGRTSPGGTVEGSFKMRAESLRLAMVGRANGRLTFETRSPLLHSITPAAFAEQQARRHPPTFAGKGLAVGVYQDSYGGPTILQALQAMPGVEARPIYSLKPDFLAPCRAVIVPQPQSAPVLSAAKDDLRAFVQGGGFLLVTHDAVGFRLDPVLVPEVCAGGSERVEDDRWRLTAELPAEGGLKVGETFHHTFWDHDLVTPGPAGKIVATDASDRPLIVVGPFGKGKFCACGIALGIERTGDRDVPLSDAESRLLRGLLLEGTS